MTLTQAEQLQQRRTQLTDLLHPAFYGVSKDALVPPDAEKKLFQQHWNSLRSEAKRVAIWAADKFNDPIVWNDAIEATMDEMAESYHRTFYLEQLAQKLHTSEEKAAQTPEEEAEALERFRRRGLVIQTLESKIAEYHLQHLQETACGLTLTQASHLLKRFVFETIEAYYKTTGVPVIVQPRADGMSPTTLVREVGEYARVHEEAALKVYSPTIP